MASLLDRRGAAILLTPAWLLLTATIVLPAAYVLWLSFQASSFGQAPRFVGVANYRAVLSDPYFWRALWNTLLIVVVVVHVELVAALGMALLFAAGLRARPVWIAVVLAPYAVSEVAAVVMWRFLLDPDTGALTRALEWVGLPGLDWAVVPGAWADHCWGDLGLAASAVHVRRVVCGATGLAAGDIYEAARVDGASRWQQFRRLTLPLLRPAILVALLFRYIFAFRLFSEIWLTTQGGPARRTEVVAVYLYLEAFRYDQFGVAAATGWIMVIVAALVAALYVRRMARDG